MNTQEVQKFDPISFLSCLCGSEPTERTLGGSLLFLSCLCGSERYDTDFSDCHLFLSCLCGSEH